MSFGNEFVKWSLPLKLVMIVPLMVAIALLGVFCLLWMPFAMAAYLLFGDESGVTNNENRN